MSYAVPPDLILGKYSNCSYSSYLIYNLYHEILLPVIKATKLVYTAYLILLSVIFNTKF